MRYPALFFLLALAVALTQFVDVQIASSAELYTVNSTGNQDDSDPSDTICDSDLVTPGEQCTLRAAIKQASQDPDQDTIRFNIDPLDLSNDCADGFCFITPNPALPTVSNPAIIDGTTQPGYVDKPVIVVDAALSGATSALRVTGGDTTVRGLTIVRSLSHGIEISLNDGNTIEGNFIGIDWTGLVTDPTPQFPGNGDEWWNNGSGVYLNNVSNNTIGGTTPNKRNLIAGNRVDGVTIVGGSLNTVAGNYIGVDVAGAQDRGNDDNGVRIQDSSNNTIGGSNTAPGVSCAGACNLISGQRLDGVAITGPGSTGNQVAGNFIGTKAAGVGRFNNRYGVLIDGAPGNTIGGTTPATRNVISGNSTADLRIEDAGATDNVVRGNFIGTDLTGTLKIDPFLVAGKGIVISGAPNNTIGGSTGTTPTAGCAGACNVISGHSGDGIEIGGFGVGATGATGNIVQGNYIGVDAFGGSEIPNGNVGCTSGSGILVNGAPGNTIGGNDDAERNVISGNRLAGIEFRATTSDNNVVYGNYIGTNKTGNAGIGNCKYGVYINGAENEKIGGVNPGEGNVISGNAPVFVGFVGGIFIHGTAAKTNTISGNLIGTDANGEAALGNGGAGIFVNGAPNNTIGGTNPGNRNVISGNTVRGVEIVGPASGNKLLGNYIGLDIDGQQAVPNGGNGVLLTNAPSNIIGGLAPGAENVISGNAAIGIDIVDPQSTGNVVQGNLIGTNVTGASGVGNGSHGIRISHAPGNAVGGTLPDTRNVISGNGESGVYIEGISAQNNQVRGNFIGVALNGTTPLGNADNGVHVAGSASSNTVGGPADGAGNIIASNGEDGIFVDQTAGTGNSASQNEIRDNGQLGIDLGTPGDVAPGVTQNDPGDADVNGGNELQNFPLVTLAESDNDATPGTHITGSLNSKANASFTIDLYASPACDPSGYGEGDDHLGSADLTTDGSGNAAFDVIFAFHTPFGWSVTATATDSIGNTSEFSQCETVISGVVTPPPGVTPTPEPTPPPGTLIQGDVNCQGGVNAVDALALLRYTAGLPVTKADGCPDIGTNLPPVWGNVNCDGSVGAVDALAVLRWVAGLPVNQQPGCTLIGQPMP